MYSVYDFDGYFKFHQQGDEGFSADDAVASLVCRPAQPADTMQINAVFREAYLQWIKRNSSKSVVDALLPTLFQTPTDLLDSGTYFVAEDCEGEIVAIGGWSQISFTNEMAERDRGYLRRFAVRPDYQGRGIGTALLGSIVENARLTGLNYLDCYATINASTFYVSRGFEKHGVRKIEGREGVQILMTHLRYRLNSN